MKLYAWKHKCKNVNENESESETNNKWMRTKTAKYLSVTFELILLFISIFIDWKKNDEWNEQHTQHKERNVKIMMD